MATDNMFGVLVRFGLACFSHTPRKLYRCEWVCMNLNIQKTPLVISQRRRNKTM